MQAEISFNESSVFTFDLCNIWFVSVGFHCQITIVSEVLLTTSFLLSWWQMRWAFELTCIVLAWAFAKDFQCSCLFFHFEFCWALDPFWVLRGIRYSNPCWVLQGVGYSYPFWVWFHSSFVMTGTVATFYSSFVMTGTVATLNSSFVYLYLTVAWSSKLLVFHCGLSLLTLALCFLVQGGWEGSSRASPSSIIAADNDDLEHQLRLGRGAPWLWKAAHDACDHGLRKFKAMQGM